jgi:7,8-dihydro-6-hydroxymethylpterin dimethyltransferase
MEQPNLGICNHCRDRVPARFLIRDGQVWIHKDCPACGANESLVSTDAKVWQAKGQLCSLLPSDGDACTMRCDRCQIDHKPNIVFLDVTNRCNMNCPICIATIRGMGFDFNPPLAYFEKVFAELGRMIPKPVVQLFGGEPTVREDLLKIIAIGRKHGLRPHVFTNGVRLADEEYCRALCRAGVPLRFAFDGRSPDIYERLRGNRGAYEKKMKALANLEKYSHRKHSIIACAAWGFNDQYIGDLLQFCHDNRHFIPDIGIVPLTENWKPGDFEVKAHTTVEDVEKMIQQSVPGGGVEFIPAGLSYSMRKPRSFFERDSLSEVLLFAGVHPNCESMTLLISDVKTSCSINHYLKRPLSQVALECAALSKQIEPQLDRLDPDKFFQRIRGQLLVIRTLGWWGLRTVRIWRLKPIRSLAGAAFQHFFRKLSRLAGFRIRRSRRIFRVVVLPIEEQHSIDAARLKSCKAAFAYEDVDDGRVKYFPACSWYPYRNPLLEKISQKYGVVSGKDVSGG